jgi:hypothetical protein
VFVTPLLLALLATPFAVVTLIAAAENWIGNVVPPPPGWVVDADEVVGLVTTTLPTEAAEEASAASVAAVDKSPATAANAA